MVGEYASALPAPGSQLPAPSSRIKCFCEPEVQHLHPAVVSDLDVRGFQIAMDDVLLMRGFERLRDLLRDRQRLVEWNRATRDALRQILAFDEFHHQRAIFEAMDLRDVRVIERCEGLRFALEAHQPIGIAGEQLWQDLQRRRDRASYRGHDTPRPCRRRRFGR